MTDRLDKAIEAVKAQPIPPMPSALEARLLNRLPEGPTETFKSPWILPVKTAAAAAVLILIGFTAGRWSGPGRLDPAQIQDMRASIKSELYDELGRAIARDWTAAKAAAFEQIQTQVDRQIQTNLNAFAVQVLKASNQATAELAGDLVRLVQANQFQERKRVDTALSQIEYNRLNSEALFKTHLTNLAQITEDQIQRTDTLVTLIAHEPPSPLSEQ